MNAVPKCFPPSEIDNFEKYQCPISGVSARGNNAPSRWVECPLVKGAICYGSCLDLQSIARDEEFETHPFVDIFYKLSQEIDAKVIELRKTCLTHQREVLQDMLNDPLENNSSVRQLLDFVVSTYDCLGE